MTIQEKVGKRICNIRKEVLKLSQEKFAYEADIERSFFTHIEKGNKNISVGTLERVITALGVSFQEFFNDEIFSNSGKKKKKN